MIRHINFKQKDYYKRRLSTKIVEAKCRYVLKNEVNLVDFLEKQIVYLRYYTINGRKNRYYFTIPN